MSKRVKLDILGVDFAVELVDSLRFDDGETLWGITDFDKLEITLERSPRRMRVRTLLHELCHTIFHANPALKMLLMDIDNEEAFCDSLSVALADIMLRNKLFNAPPWLFQETDHAADRGEKRLGRS